MSRHASARPKRNCALRVIHAVTRGQSWRRVLLIVREQIDTATGTLARYVPAGADRDRLLGLVRIGTRFAQQHTGRRPGFLHGYIVATLARMASPVTFEQLLDELETEAARRNLGANCKAGSPVESVNRVWEVVTYHDPKCGRQQVPFGTLRNKFTFAKRTPFTGAPKP